MEGTASSSRPSVAHDAAAARHARYAGNPETHTERRPAQAQGRVNQASPEVISNLIVSLSSISDQSEQLFDRLLPVQERPARQQPRSTRRNQAGHATKKEAPPPVPTLFREDVATAAAATGATATTTAAVSAADDRFNRPELNNETRPSLDPRTERSRLDTGLGRLPAVQEVASPSSPGNMQLQASLVASHRPKLASHPPPVEVPRRSMSLRSNVTMTPGLSTGIPAEIALDDSDNPENGRNGDSNNNADGREAFASISIQPGKSASESIISGDSAGKRTVAAGKGPTRAKSTKDKIRALDQQQKERRKKAARGATTPRSATSQRSPAFSKLPSSGLPSPGLPSPSFLADEIPPSPTKNGFLAPAPRGPSRNNVDYGSDTNDADADADADDFLSQAGPSDLSKLKRPHRPAVNGGAIAIPSRVSSRQGADTPARASSRASSLGPSRAGSRSRSRPKQSDIPPLPFDRDEADTTKRIQQLQQAKEERNKKEEKRLAGWDGAPRSILGDITSNGGGPARLDTESLDPRDRKRSMTEERPRRTKSIISGVGSEPRDSLQVPRSYSQPTFTARPKEHDVYSMADSIDDAVEDYVTDPRLSQTIYHPVTKRCISYSDVGDPDGAVIICCVGMGTTRYVTAFFDELARMYGLRLITPERPGIGDSEPYGQSEMDTPLGWPDDVKLICQHLNIKRFMLLAHSAGAVYALATALRMPHEIRGRIHILAPWIPPSQLQAIGLNEEPVPVAELPLIQRILRSIPEPLLEAATRIFNMSSITSSLGKSPYAKRRRRNTTGAAERDRKRVETPALAALEPGDAAGLEMRTAASSPTPHTEGLGSPVKSRRDSISQAPRNSSVNEMNATKFDEAIAELTEEERAHEYEMRLAATIWNLATSNANPAIDLMVCLERRQEIGFRYEDITKPVVMHHGTKDTRVSVENVVWIGDKMRRCDVRVLEGQGHGLMASSTVMSDLLAEMAQDWEDWNTLVRAKR